MQQTSDTYKRIIQDDHHFETSITIEEPGSPIGTIDPDSGFREDKLFSVDCNSELFKDGYPGAGYANAAYVDISMVAPENVPKNARMCIYVRAVNGTEKSEWIQQGVYYIDTREQTHDDRGFDVLTVHCYDAMLLSEVTWPSSNSNDYPMLDKDMVQFIADHMKIDTDGNGVHVDTRTWDAMTAGYKFPLPVGYSMREVLCMIAAAYGSNFIITQTGELRLVSMFDIPPETNHLITEDGYKITFGGIYIVV